MGAALAAGAGLVVLGCSSPKYAYHSVYTLTSCSREVSRDGLARDLVRRGYLRASDPKGPYDLFRKPDIAKRDKLFASEPYEDRAGEIAVATCVKGGESFLVAEEWKGCEGKKDCTEGNRQELKAVAESWGCRVQGHAGHSRSWEIEDRQDWTRESCAQIVSNLAF